MVFVIAICGQISIHALREEGDIKVANHRIADLEFLSTPSARRATPAPCCNGADQHHFYPRPPRGGRPCTLPRPS